MWALLLKRRFGIPSRLCAGGPLVSACSTAAGFTPPSCYGAAAPERTIGWILHYAVGIAFAFIPIGLAGIGWYTAPEPLIALLSGWLSPRRVSGDAARAGFGVAAAKTAYSRKRGSSACSPTRCMGWAC
ncbi:DUF2938 family protein [Serratia marcescens]|uniref:DUF2938 family protein n=1 Tax=Serratia marcescens TaxID=615 RepID=A0A939NQ37_SERMA|nr:DUF2938 family protein [Serratia marcescens]